MRITAYQWWELRVFILCTLPRQSPNNLTTISRIWAKTHLSSAWDSSHLLIEHNVAAGPTATEHIACISRMICTNMY